MSISHIQEAIPGLKWAIVGEPWCKAVMYKHGPPHELDLDLDDVMDELSIYKDRADSFIISESGDDELQM